MIWNFCDICGKDITPSLHLSFKDTFDSRLYVSTRVDDESVKRELCLCANCNKQLLYCIQNHAEARKRINRRKPMNRLRYLLNLPLKE